MRKIIFTRPDGGVSIVSIPVDTDEALAAALAKLPPTAIAPRIIDESVVPTDRTFRNALKPDLTIDMPKARNIQRDRMRRAREPKFAVLDAAYMRADEIGDIAEKQRIAILKQALRAVTADPAIEAATTPNELKAIWPDILRS